ncbi:hypothetical protein T484DRAFT_2600159 [Baffinella frigidus]|nr:hypothetical protein T484DRAFT_2600159 [Cryptophyta sp. CCMP2293]
MIFSECFRSRSRQITRWHCSRSSRQKQRRWLRRPSSSTTKVYAFNPETTEDPFLFPATGLRVDAVAHDRLCMSQGCWVIDFTFTLGTNDTMNALYLPRIYNDDTLTPHVYSQAVQDTFGVKNFPCRNEMYDPNNPTQRKTSCCLPTFDELYRPIASFGEFLGTSYASGELSVCNATLPKLAPPSNFLPETDFLSPDFPDMPLSRVSVWLDEPYVRIWKGQARLDDHELRQHAAMLGETPPPFAAHTITTFLGLAHFSPTGTTTFLDSAASQTTITLTKNDWMTVATLSGINEYTFFDYCNMRLHQVRAGGAPLQFIAAAFTLGCGQGGARSRRLPTGPTRATPPPWTRRGTRRQRAMPTTLPSIQTAPLTPRCARARCTSRRASLCSSSPSERATRLLTPPRAWTQASSSTWWCPCLTNRRTSNGRRVSSGRCRWSPAGPSSTARRSPPCPSSRRSPAFDYNSSLDSDSIESGLISVILKGNETFFQMPGAVQRGFELELEDAITVHFMELPPQPRFEQMFALIHSGKAFGVSVDIANKQASLVAEMAFVAVCPFTMSAAIPCVARRDVLLRGFPTILGSIPTAMEVNVSDGTTDEAGFMQGILGRSEYAAQLGANFSYILSDKFALNRRYRRAWWVNPGFTWNKQQYVAAGFDRYSVSQRVMLVLLSGPGGGASLVGKTSLWFNVPPNSIVGGALFLPLPVSLDFVSATW